MQTLNKNPHNSTDHELYMDRGSDGNAARLPAAIHRQELISLQVSLKRQLNSRQSTKL